VFPKQFRYDLTFSVSSYSYPYRQADSGFNDPGSRERRCNIVRTKIKQELNAIVEICPGLKTTSDFEGGGGAVVRVLLLYGAVTSHQKTVLMKAFTSSNL